MVGGLPSGIGSESMAIFLNEETISTSMSCHRTKNVKIPEIIRVLPLIKLKRVFLRIRLSYLKMTFFKIHSLCYIPEIIHYDKISYK